jgi:outer membrane protein assembly factor BamE
LANRPKNARRYNGLIISPPLFPMHAPPVNQLLAFQPGPRESAANVRTPLAMAALCVLLLGGCSGTGTSGLNPVNWITPYRVDVIQGNFISREQVDLLKPGLTRAQVRDVLGTPLLASVFHADRWDYVFTLKRRNVVPQAYKYAVFFKGDVLERFEGDAMPSESEFIATLASARRFGKVPALEATEEQLSRNSSKPPIGPQGTAGTVTPAPGAGIGDAPSPTSYPPLESPAR